MLIVLTESVEGLANVKACGIVELSETDLYSKLKDEEALKKFKAARQRGYDRKKQKYINDPEYREKERERAREAYRKKKAANGEEVLTREGGRPKLYA